MSGSGTARRSAISLNDTQQVQKPQPAQPVAPTGNDAAVDAYRRAVGNERTGFSNDPFVAAARTMDKLSKAVGGLFSKADGAAGSGNIAQAEAALGKAVQAAKANPNSVEARQQQLVAAGRMFAALQAAGGNDPRMAKLAAMMVRLAGQLGPQGLPLHVPGLDMRGLLAAAAKLVSRFGSPQGMQQAMAVEQMLASGRGALAPDARQLLLQLAQQQSISRSALQSIIKNWTVKIVPDNTLANVDTSARTIALNQQHNSSLAALAKAHWIDQQLQQPTSRDGLVNAFVKIMNSGKHADLARKYRQQRTLDEAEAVSRGQSRATPEGEDAEVMFAALVDYSASGGRDLPPELQSAVNGFLLRV